jgi:DNA-binding winged helix-turn-helix (wHTH) protein/tetratricopeptide (TPR) repeat protein
MDDDPKALTRVQFGNFELDRRSGELLKGGSRLRLQEGPLRVLQALIDRHGEIVTREELRRRLWPDETFVDFDNGLNSAVNRLRTALGDRAERPRFVETVGRRGYRFVATLSVTDPRPPEPGGPSTVVSRLMRLAVVPFRQLVPDPETEFLTFSLADAIASALSGLESLVVRSPIAAARFVSDVPDLAAMSAALDVSLALVGSVLRAGDRVRVSAQLVEVPRGTLLWTTTAETSLDGLFRVLDGLVRRIVESLALPLTVNEARLLEHDVPGNGHAFELYLRANRLGRYPDTWPQARDLYLESVRADPRYAPSWARLGRTYRMMAKYAADADPQLVQLAEASFRRALSVNPELSLAHYLYAQLEMETGRSVDAFVRLLDRARERRADPQLFGGLVQACRYVGLLEASRAAHERARRLDPTIRTSIAYTSAVVGDYVRAAEEARDNDDPFEAIALALAGQTSDAIGMLRDLQGRYGTNQVWATYIAVIMAATRGSTEEIVSAVEACLRLPFGDPEGLFHICVVLARASEPARAIMALRRTVDAGFSCPAALDGEPSLRTLHGNPDFEALRPEVEHRHLRAVQAFESAGGDALLI